MAGVHLELLLWSGVADCAQCLGDPGGETGIIPHQRDVCGQGTAFGQLKDALQQIRGDGLATDAMCICVRLGLGNHRRKVGGRDFVCSGHRIGNQLSTGQPQQATHVMGACNVFGRVHAQGRAQRRTGAPATPSPSVTRQRGASAAICGSCPQI